MHFQYITDENELNKAVETWKDQCVIALDTEFVRDRSYYPMLGLVQIAVEGQCFVIDLVSIKNAHALRRLFSSPDIVKVIHACGEDVDALFHHFHELPQNLFDTQMAAALLNIGPQVGYSFLVEHYFGVQVPKGLSRADWLARPLANDLLAYAADDVAYLEAIYKNQVNALTNKQWLQNFKDDCDAILDKKRYHPIPENMYLKVKGAFRLQPQELTILRELAAWRELKARERNLPRNFVVKDSVLLDVAKLRPSSIGQLSRINGLHSADVRKIGQRLLRCVELGLSMPKEKWPERIVNIMDVENSKQLVTQLKQAAELIARAEDIPVNYLANRKFIEQYILYYNKKIKEPPRLWRSWRKGLLEKSFERCMNR